MTFRVIDLVTDLGAGLSGSTVPETDYTAWSSGTSYVRGDRVISTTTHRIYECARANVGKNPALKTNRYTPASDTPSGATATGYWIDVGATNRWRVFDQRLYDQARQATSMQWTILLSTAIDSVSVLGLSGGAATVQCEVLVSGSPISSSTINLSASDVNLKRATFLGLAGSVGRSLRITVAGTGTVYCGEIVAGTVRGLGTALVDTEFGFASYSRNDRDEYGNPIVIPRKRGDTARVKAFCAASDKDRVLRVLGKQDAVVAAYLIGDPNAPEGGVILGYAEAPMLVLSSPTQAEYILDLKSVI